MSERHPSDPTQNVTPWRDGWAAGQIDGSCSTASELLALQDPLAAARGVLADVRRRFGNRATKSGAYRDLKARIERHTAG